MYTIIYLFVYLLEGMGILVSFPQVLSMVGEMNIYIHYSEAGV